MLVDRDYVFASKLRLRAAQGEDRFESVTAWIEFLPLELEIISSENGQPWDADAFDDAEGMWHEEVALVAEGSDPEGGPATLAWATSINC